MQCNALQNPNSICLKRKQSPKIHGQEEKNISSHINVGGGTTPALRYTMELAKRKKNKKNPTITTTNQIHLQEKICRLLE